VSTRTATGLTRLTETIHNLSTEVGAAAGDLTSGERQTLREAAAIINRLAGIAAQAALAVEVDQDGWVTRAGKKIGWVETVQDLKHPFVAYGRGHVWLGIYADSADAVAAVARGRQA
jgi:hypothetical protein